MKNEITPVEIVKSYKCDGAPLYGVQWENGQVCWADSKAAARLLKEIAQRAQHTKRITERNAVRAIMNPI